jgi:integrase
MKAKIGLNVIAAQPPGPFLIWDTDVRGFNVRRQFSDVVTFSIVYRTLEGTQRWQSIGRLGIWTPDKARKQAQRVLMARDVGNDPAAEKKALRSAPTLSELCDEYQERDNGKKSTTVRGDRSRINVHIKPKLGKSKVASITTEQVEDFMRSLSAGSKSRVVGLLGAIFTYAVKRKLRSDNPCKGVDLPAQAKRTRRLSDAEYAQFGVKLNGGIVSDIFLLLAVTGWRSSEAKNLRWAECDFERNIVTLEDTKSGASVRPLSNVSIEIIKRQKQSGTPYVFDHGQGKPIVDLRHNWSKLEMPKDVTPHILRHSFASLAADSGLPDHTISRLLGHSQKSVTSRYIHMERALIEASDIVASATLKLLHPNIR